MKTHRTLLIAAALGLLLLAGCGDPSRKSVEPASAQSRVFEQAQPESKQLWDQALVADKANDYLAAETLLYRLLNQPLQPEQQQAVKAELAVLNQRLASAVQRGEPKALAALQELRNNPPNRQR